MSEKQPEISRRQVIKIGAAGLAMLPLSRLTSAQEGGAKVKESDDLAQQLGYRHDAAQVDASKFSKRAGAEGAQQFCRTCQFFQGGDAAWGACTVFGGNQVNANGWCNSWFKRTG